MEWEDRSRTMSAEKRIFRARLDIEYPSRPRPDKERGSSAPS